MSAEPVHFGEGLAARWVNWPEYFERVLPHDRDLIARDLAALAHHDVWDYQVEDGTLYCTPRRPEYALTWHDLQERPDFCHWVFELLEGMLVVTRGAPTLRHQDCVGSLMVLLRGAAPPHLKVIVGPFDYVSDAPFSVQPDVMVARRPVGAARLSHPPELVVEVLSRGTVKKDRGKKRIAYERAGVPHYWLVDPDVPSVELRRLRGDRYETVGVVAAGELVMVDAPMVLCFDPAELIDE